MNRRLNEILRNTSPLSEEPDVIFVTETAVGYEAIPTIRGYNKYADKDVQVLNHGGIAFYIRRKLAPHVFNVDFKTCYVSFRLNFVPTLVFIGCYIQPENSKYFDPDMFSELGSFLISLREKKLAPIMGGDLNCRFGDLNQLMEGQGMLYENNADPTTNKHGRTYGKDLCTVGDIFPLNHLKYRSRVFAGDFTYFKGGKKSQIDFIFTNKAGLRSVKDFDIGSCDWHLSDHRSTSITITTSKMLNSAFIFRRAKELNYDFQPNRSTITRHLGEYDHELFEKYLKDNELIIETEILDELRQCNIDKATIKLDLRLQEAHRVSKKKALVPTNAASIYMEEANHAFENYQKSLAGNFIDTPDEAYEKYQKARNKVTSGMCAIEHDKWKKLVTEESPKAVWEKIDWKGNFSKSEMVKPTNDELALHFEKLYSCDDEEEAEKIAELSTDAYVPTLDDPICQGEIDGAIGEMKKGGYDYQLSILKVVARMMAPLLIMFFNIMFYVAYPVSLAKSLLSALPKKGNLSLPVNYRGIQMLAAVSALYDRILTIRLRGWCLINYLQSAFQQGKSTIHQIFTLRILIEIAKRKNTTLYIGFFDLEKAFDKVSRLLLLKRLRERGIGNCMLQALKRIYLHTTCIIGKAANASEEFRTYSGIRQGAPSSVLLFICFMDELFSFLETHCIAEPILNMIHCLLHANDTVIISTDRKMFIKKCNTTLKYFKDNSMSLNSPK